MDQEAFKETYQRINERQCVFEKAILTHQCKCSAAQKLNIAEREAIHCGTDTAQAQCVKFLDTLKKHARFALKLTDNTKTLPHGKAIKIQVGGLRGLQQVLNPDQNPLPPINDVTGLISQALETYKHLDELPFSIIMQQVAAYQGRKRVSRRT